MGWIIFFGLVVVFFIVILALGRDEIPIGVLTVFIAGGISGMCIVNGLTIAPQLIGDKMEVLTLKSEISRIEHAYYPEGNKKAGLLVNKLVEGSIENFKQSTNLSNYIKDYAVKKAQYNSKLARIKFMKKSSAYFWFAHGMFISKEVLNMTPID